MTLGPLPRFQSPCDRLSPARPSASLILLLSPHPRTATCCYRSSPASIAALTFSPSLACLYPPQDLLSHPSFFHRLGSPSQPVRRALLQLLNCYAQPPMEGYGAATGTPPQVVASQSPAVPRQGAAAVAATVAAAQRCEFLPLLLAINTQPFSIDAGRRWGVALTRVRSQLEYGRCV